MQVDLITMTENPLDVMCTAAKTCYSTENPIDIYTKDTTEEAQLKFLNKVLGSKHESVSEHCSFVFSISGLSRPAMAQLTRHRIASFSVQSTRYVDFNKKKLDKLTDIKDIEGIVQEFFVIPDTVLRKPETFIEFCVICYESLLSYQKLIKAGIPPEDARGVLASNFKTNIVCTFNFRSFMHLCNERLCTKAQKEIRQLVSAMAALVVEEHPWMREYFQPKCVPAGRCSEAKSCGRF